MSDSDNPPTPILSLACCVCLSVARGRQWWNRDTGYGICNSCADDMAKIYSPETMRDYYGIEGVHYKVQEQAACPP
jgi:hypothetical protein